ncbi:MAG: acyl-CoA dehydrogenase family protein [Deltaproteobacteria bacterium]|nr:acyl-CoA dehydrogenase family protein [Deltaproteobacteria bacterium]MCL5277756.1 acyl-CoA dehydrogenase family protein [Deltaproteobacteria bacterium]
MDFELTEDQKKQKESFAGLCAKEIAPRAEFTDKEAVFPEENIRLLGKVGFLGMGFPEEYGGSKGDPVIRAVLGEELAKACASTYLSAGASSGLFGIPVLKFGTQTQKKKYLPGVLSGEKMGALAITEPQAGSDMLGMKTGAQKSGNGWLINGSKTLITNGPVADYYVVAAYTDKEKKRDGISLFIVEKGTKGFSSGKPFDKLGVRGSPTSDLFFDGCEVPGENLLGEVNKGFLQLARTLSHGRIGMAVYSLGIAQACLEESISYAQERTAFGKKLAHFQDVHFKIADMKMYIDVGRELIYKAAWMLDQDDSQSVLFASIAKLFMSEHTTKIASDAVQIFGGYGFIKGYKVERLYRDSKLGEIGEGTSEIQRTIITKLVEDQY